MARILPWSMTTEQSSNTAPFGITGIVHRAEMSRSTDMAAIAGLFLGRQIRRAVYPHKKDH